MESTKAIILDLDLTLINAKSRTRICSHAEDGDIVTANYIVKPRPFLFEFIENCFDITPYVIIWTSANSSYYEEVANFLSKRFSFYKVITRCTYGTHNKDVDRMRRDDPILMDAEIVFIDDYPTRISHSTGRVVVHPIKAFHTVITDAELIADDEMEYDFELFGALQIIHQELKTGKFDSTRYDELDESPLEKHDELA